MKQQYLHLALSATAMIVLLYAPYLEGSRYIFSFLAAFTLGYITATKSL